MIGTKLSDRFEILGEIGRGGMGVVYRAHDPLLQREVAIKMLPPGALSHESEERFKREMRIVAGMDHWSIVPVYDSGQHEGALFFVMPYVKGTSLRGLIEDRSLRLGETVDVIVQVAEALEYSHARGIIHRDMKPENILVTREATGALRARVSDFGLAMGFAGDRLTRTGALVGTVAYLSPEQISGGEVDARSDIYALGSVLFECLVGAPPFVGDVQSVLYRIVNELPASPRSRGVGVEEEIDELILQCLEKNPRARPQHAADVVAALSAYRADLHESEGSRAVLDSPVGKPFIRPPAPPLIGRTKEIGELQRRLNQAISGECQLAVIRGEAGTGKSRLLDEIEKLAVARRILVLHGRFVQQDRAFPYQGFCEAIQEYFRWKSTGSSGHADFSDLATDLAAIFPVLSEIGEIRSGSGNTQSPLASESVTDRTSIFELLARTLARIAEGRPLVVLFEDLHAADLSIEALQYIVRRLGPTPTFFMGTYRPADVHRGDPLNRLLESYHGDRHFLLIELHPFSAADSRAFVEAFVGSTILATGLVDSVFEAAEGNPYFTSEILRSLTDSGRVAQNESGTWDLIGEEGRPSIPATVQQAVEKRIERLGPEVLETLMIASVIGKTFDFDDLLFLSGSGGDAEEAVEALLRGGFLREEAGSRGDRLTFSSGVLRDVIYLSIPRRRRKLLHRRYAEELESRNAGRLELVYPQLVHHYSEGDVPEKVIEHGLALARKSMANVSPEDAARAARTVLDFVDQDDPASRTLQVEARLLLGSALRAEGSFEGALREIGVAVGLLDGDPATDRLAGALFLAAETAWDSRRTEEARQWVERSIEVARGQEESRALPRMLSLAATLANLRGDYEGAKRYHSELESLRAHDTEAKEELLQDGSIVIGLSNRCRAQHPAQISLDDEAEILANVFETLVAVDEHGQPDPLICAGWEALDGGRVFRLSLRGDVRAQRGEPLNAPELKASIERSISLSADSLPAAFEAIQGVADFLRGAAAHVSGVIATAADQIEIRLSEPLSIYPSLLTDIRTAVAVPTDKGDSREVAGTGPYSIVLFAQDRVVLGRNPAYWKDRAPLLAEIEFRCGLTPSLMAAQFRAGALDIARDLLPSDLEDMLRDRRLNPGLYQAPKKNTYFVLLNETSPAGAQPALRKAVLSSVRVADVVRKTIGTYGQPAEGLFPPGILGHDPGRRRTALSRAQAGDLLTSSGVDVPVRLTAIAHPSYQGRFASLLNTLLATWRTLGVEIAVETSTMSAFLEAGKDPCALDMFFGRWIADYDDPDNFCFSTFHSKAGRFRSFCSSDHLDRIIEAARSAREPSVREALYGDIEEHMLGSHLLLPLFHENDTRLAATGLRRMKVSGSAPYVNYAGLAKSAAAPTALSTSGGTLHVPIAQEVRDLDPALVFTITQSEVLPAVFETLTRQNQGGPVVPWLAAELHVENGAQLYRFRLRDGIRFHDTRLMTSRDVRHSIERLLRTEASETRENLMCIKGARRFAREGGDLEGLKILSMSELTIELERPVAFFPTLLSFPSTAVIPEGCDRLVGSWRDGNVGTGPFRVQRFQPGHLLELEANPHYWRPGDPRAERLHFSFGVSPEDILAGFASGDYSLAWDLFPADVEALRHDHRFAAGYCETPRLSTYYVAFNIHRGPLRDETLRHALIASIDVPAVVRRTVGRLAVLAHGFIPPGLPGHGAPRGAGADRPWDRKIDVELKVLLNSTYEGPHAPLRIDLLAALDRAGFHTTVLDTKSEYLTNQAKALAAADLVLTRWIADYPDTETFAGLLHSETGLLGRLCGTPELDRLIESGRAESDPRVRHSLYRELEEILSRHAHMLPLFHEQSYCFARPEVEDLVLNFFPPIVPYHKLWVRR